eukprot:COSAG01_NODE_4884_length_4653_cov_20.654370_3_plen_207_part_00
MVHVHTPPTTEERVGSGTGHEARQDGPTGYVDGMDRFLLPSSRDAGRLHTEEADQDVHRGDSFLLTGDSDTHGRASTINVGITRPRLQHSAVGQSIFPRDASTSDDLRPPSTTHSTVAAAVAELSPRQRWRSSTSSTSTLIFPSHHPLHVSHITAMPEKNVRRYLNKVDSRWRACVTITRYTCILDVTLDPPKRVDYYPNYEIHFY